MYLCVCGRRIERGLGLDVDSLVWLVLEERRLCRLDFARLKVRRENISQATAWQCRGLFQAPA